MRILASTLLLQLVAGHLASQSLAELAEREKERRRMLKPEETAEAAKYDERSLHRVHHGWSAEPSMKDAERDKSVDTRTLARLEESESGSPPPTPVVLASLIDESMPEAKKDVEFQRSRGGELPMTSGGKALAATSKASASDSIFDGALYIDWFRSAYEDGVATSQLSTRVRLNAGNRPGRGWRFFMDARHRYNGSSSTTNKLIVYDARVLYDEASRPLSLSLGQMNLYETAGVGQLLGGVLGVKVNPSWTVGGYSGLEPDIYALSYDLDYLKYGVFTQYRGPNARSIAVSYNRLTYQGETERQFLYGSGLLPIGDAAVVYGSAEYELGQGISGGDRLSHLFLNTRYSFTPAADVTGYYSSGRGLDYHRFLLEQSRDPDQNSAELERFYYTESYGVRFSVKPQKQLRLFIAQRESEQKDQGIRNHTTQLGASTWDIGGSGIGLYGSYNINRGDASESDSYRVSVSRDFGPLSWTGYLSSTFNGVRFDAATGRPEIFHVPNLRTISNDFFFDLSEAFAVSVEHDLTRRGEERENTLFFRMMLRF
ncbi:MAG TPA: hypothetical protein VJH87_01545 [Vicinamibacteria bacterium]|nr:hypothetical protein [Vicinamibacteria bacterium]